MSGLAVRAMAPGHEATDDGAQNLLGGIQVRGSDRQIAQTIGSFEIAHAALHATPESVDEAFPVHHPHLDMWVVADARIDDQARLRRRLAEAGCSFEPRTDADLILAAHEVWGDDAQRELIGDFAYVVVTGDTLLAARDVMGQKPLLWTVDDNGGLLVASTLLCLLGQLPAPPPINERHIGETLVNQPSNHVDTPYVGLHRLAPGQRLLFRADTPLDVRIVDQLHVGPLLSIDENEAAQRVRAALSEAVKDRLRSPDRIGCEVSGGFDSSTVFGLARQHCDATDLVALSFVFPGLECDESEYIAAVVEGTDVETIQQDTSVADPRVLEHLVVASGEIPRYAESSRVIYEQAREAGCSAVLTGQGGDEAFSYVLGYAADLLVERGPIAAWRSSAGWSTSQRLGSLARSLAGLARWRVGAGKAGSHLRRALRLIRLRRYYPWVTPQLRRQLGSDHLRPTVVPGPWAIGRSDRLQSYTSPTCPLDYENMDRAIAGVVEIRHPFFDRRFVELILSLSPDVLNKNDGDRVLHRRAFADVLPPLVVNREDKAEFSERYPPVVEHVIRLGLATHEAGWTTPNSLVEGNGTAFSSLNRGWPVACVSAWIKYCGDRRSYAMLSEAITLANGEHE